MLPYSQRKREDNYRADHFQLSRGATRTLKIIKDYTTDSSTINNSIRDGTGFSKVKEFDEALNLLSDSQKTITYRVTTYLDGNSPWNAARPLINEGDVVKDMTYVSTSAHRGGWDIDIRKKVPIQNMLNLR